MKKEELPEMPEPPKKFKQKVPEEVKVEKKEEEELDVKGKGTKGFFSKIKEKAADIADESGEEYADIPEEEDVKEDKELKLKEQEEKIKEQEEQLKQLEKEKKERAKIEEQRKKIEEQKQILEQQKKEEPKKGIIEKVVGAVSKEEEAEEIEKVKFKIDTRPKLIKLPDIKDKTKINIRYPLLPPFAYAHIFWDDKTKELVYFLEEPYLTEQEKELLKLVQVALEEMISIGLEKATNKKFIVEYLQRNVQAILIELSVKITEQTYQKLMYYIYRNSIGMNDIEPLMRDYYIEDIECNGVDYPLYIVHRKYANMRTNVEFKDYDYIADFIEKLAQKTGRYVSFAQPLLDGALPDGSRVNATYTRDITTRGPTFTIRKFTKEPWTPINLIDFKTASPEVFAYLWLAIENKFNIMTIGETASGKTTFMNSILHFIPSEARICSVEDTRELNLIHDNWLPAVQRMGFGIPNILGEKYGEITMFDLLKETFRQNPDYMIVGEVRGKEAFVMFQGMASGHPSFGTFHAGGVEQMIRRLQTAPISLSSSLVETLDIVLVVTHVKTADKSFRRLREVNEIVEVKETLGEYKSNMVFEWMPAKDNIKYNDKSVIIERISKRTGINKKELEKEWQRRTKLLTKMKEEGLTDYKQFNTVINNYYKNRAAVLKQFSIR